MSTNYRGIDYSMGLSNVDRETGIRYGVISSHTPASWIYEVMDEGADYGQPVCPECGNPVKASDDETLFNDIEIDDIVFRAGISAAPDGTPDWFDGKDFTCMACEACYWSDEVYSYEPIGWSHEADGYKLCDCLDSDVFVLASPYYTYAQYCSPCVPGACNLDSPIDTSANNFAMNTCSCNGWCDCHKPDWPVGEACDCQTVNKAYCLGPEWFDTDNPCPYRMWRVADGVEVTSCS